MYHTTIEILPDYDDKAIYVLSTAETILLECKGNEHRWMNWKIQSILYSIYKRNLWRTSSTLSSNIEQILRIVFTIPGGIVNQVIIKWIEEDSAYLANIGATPWITSTNITFKYVFFLVVVFSTYLERSSASFE